MKVNPTLSTPSPLTPRLSQRCIQIGTLPENWNLPGYKPPSIGIDNGIDGYLDKISEGLREWGEVTVLGMEPALANTVSVLLKVRSGDLGMLSS